MDSAAELVVASCAACATLLYTQRRDRRLRAQVPLWGAVLVGGFITTFVIWRFVTQRGQLTNLDGSIVRVALALSGGLAVPFLLAAGRALIRQDVPRFLRTTRARPKPAIAYTLLCLACSAAYFALGTQLGQRGGFVGIDKFFDADPGSYAGVGGVLTNTHKHPLLPLLWQVSTVLARPFVGRPWSGLAVNSVCGGIAVALCAAYFYALTKSALLALLGALLLGATAAHLVFGAVPESYMLSGASLLMLHVLVARTAARGIRLRHWVLAAVVAGGVTITNAVPAILCFAIGGPFRRRARLAWRWAAAGMLSAAALVSIQNLLFPRAAPLQVGAYLLESGFVEYTSSPGRRAVNLGRGMLLQNVVAAKPIEVIAHSVPGLAWDGYEDFVGRVVLTAWVLLAASGVLVVLRSGAWRARTFAAAVACLVAAAALHAYYGNENLFLYSCTFTFPLLATLGHALCRPSGQPETIRAQRIFPRSAREATAAVALGSFLLLLLINNGMLFWRALFWLDWHYLP